MTTHIVIGHSALQLIRCARMQEADRMASWFPAVKTMESQAFLPCQEISQPDVSSDEKIPDYSETLEIACFPFGLPSANRRPDISYFDAPIKYASDNPLELGIFNDSQKVYRKSVRTKMLKRSLPCCALMQAGKNLYFSSPEFVVTQLAAKMGPVKLAQVIMELTGSYATSPVEDCPEWRTHYGLKPVTTLKRIEAFAHHVKGMRGRDTLRQALELAMEDSASPAETILAIYIRASLHDAGFDFGSPLLNPRIDTPEAHATYVGKSHYYPDIFFQSGFVSIEYDSLEFHVRPDLVRAGIFQLEASEALLQVRADEDRRRMRDLQALGIRVIPVSASDLRSSKRLDQVIWALVRHMEESCEIDLKAQMNEFEQLQNLHARVRLLEILNDSRG